VPQVDFQIEPWSDFWPDAADLTQEEFDEHVGMLRLTSPHVPDVATLSALVDQGRLVLATARVNGAIGAYLGWIVDANVESKGQVIYRQGPLYAAKRFAKHSLGVRLLRKSLELIQRNVVGYVEVDLHHPPLGRGARLGGVFKALGATEVARHYRLRISERTDHAEH
jgi:hypothetical protein